MTETPPTIDTLAVSINAAHAAAQASAQSAIEHAHHCGELLIQAKAAVPHGGWLPWLKAHTTVSERTAQGYMRLATHWEALQAKAQRVADLPLRDALALIAEPAPAGAEEIRRYIPLVTLPFRLPTPDTIMVGRWRDLECWIAPSTSEGFLYVTRLANKPDGGTFAEGLRRPIRADCVGWYVKELHFPVDEATWTPELRGVWDHNMWLETRTAPIGGGPEGRP